MNDSVIAHRIPSACKVSGLGRTSIYEAIRSGALPALKRGKCTLITDDALRRYVQSLPPVPVNSAQSRANGGSNDR